MRISTKLSIMTLLVLISFGLSSYAQEVTVSGRITDGSDGRGLAGATVLEKGTQNGVITDGDGTYTINVSDNATLVISFIGFIKDEIAVQGRSTINVSMEPDLDMLSEVVVVGYGTAERKEVTSAVVSVGSEDFNAGNINDPVQLLQGKVAGLSIAKPGSDPNGGYTIRLRGLSTFGANSQPLVVIDGVLGGSLQLVDPNDIESIEVLKDASAAAIYGTRGASGVIIVTTKSATGNSAPRVNFNAYVSFEEIAKSVDNSTKEEYLEAGGPDNGFDTDWLDLVTRTGVSQVYNLSVSQGFGSGSYTASINSRNIEGIGISSGFDQINARLGITQTALNDKLLVNLNFGVTKREATFMPYEAMRFAIIADPTQSPYINGDPSMGYWESTVTPEYQNPYAIAKEVTDDGIYKTQLASIKVDYEVLEGLNVAGFYSLQSQSDLRSQYFSSKTAFANASGQNGRATKFAEDRTNELFELTGTFKREISSDIKLNAVLGYSYQKFEFNNFSAFNTDFITDDLLYNALELGLGTSTGDPSMAGSASQREESILISYFGRAIFNVLDTYFLTATYRREGSSKFGENNRWGNFYAFSGGVDIAQILDVPQVNTLKLRAGYGVTGNLPNQNYEYLVRIEQSGRIPFNDETLQIINIASNPNPDLKWEEKAEWNVGVDFGFFNTRLTGSVDVYKRNTTDVLRTIGVSVPPNFFPNTLLNIGELESRGLEVALNYGVLDNTDWSINTGLIFSTNKTEVVTIDGDTEVLNIGNLGPPGLNNTFVIRFAEGEEIGKIMAPTFLGLNEDGTRNVVDINDDGTIDQDNDAVVAGYGLPDFDLAWNTYIRFRKFDLSMVWRGVFGHSLANINRAYYESPGVAGIYNPVRTKYFLPDLTENEDWNSYYVEKADFVKLDNISIGFNPTFKTDVIKSLRIYFTAQNPFVFTDYTGVDPEVHYSYGGNNLAPGVDDRNSYFRSRTYQIGVNIGL